MALMINGVGGLNGVKEVMVISEAESDADYVG